MPSPDVRPDAVAGDLRAQILALSLTPDVAVTEAYVASTYGVARPTARIAIDRLVSDGLLVREPHRAARVRRLVREDLDDLFISRAAIEAAAIEQLAGSASVPVEALEAHAELCGLPPDAPYTLADISFHRALVHGSGSTRLPRLHDLLMGEIELGIAQINTRRLRSVDEVATEHQRILDAITEGDAELAGRVARTHVLASRDRLIAHDNSIHGR